MTNQKNLSTNEIRSFVLIVELGTFHKAAKYLNRTQSALTQQIQSLEREIEVKLFKRSGRTKTLTEQGKDFYMGARQLLAVNDLIVSQLDNKMLINE